MKFTVYSKDGCPYCDRIITVLGRLSYDFEVLKLNTNFNRMEFYQQFGEGSTFPQVIYEDPNGQRNLGGCQDTVKFLQEMTQMIT